MNINVLFPYLIVEEENNLDKTTSGFIISTSSDSAVSKGVVIASPEESNIMNGDIILFLKSQAYKFIYDSKEYYIVSEKEDVFGIIK